MSNILLLGKKNPICSISSQEIDVPKEFNIGKHYETNHGKKYCLFISFAMD